MALKGWKGNESQLKGVNVLPLASIPKRKQGMNCIGISNSVMYVRTSYQYYNKEPTQYCWLSSGARDWGICESDNSYSPQHQFSSSFSSSVFIRFLSFSLSPLFYLTSSVAKLRNDANVYEPTSRECRLPYKEKKGTKKKQQLAGFWF